MLSTTIFIAIFIGLMFVSLVFWGVFLGMGLRWAKVPEVTSSRIVWTTVIAGAFGIVLSIVSALINKLVDSDSIWLGLANLAIGVAVPIAIISIAFRTSAYKAFLAWLPTLMLTLGTLGLTILVIRPYVFEAYSIPTNGMAPTLLGPHWEGTCPECASKCFCSPTLQAHNVPDSSLMICENFHVTESSEQFHTIHSGDRIMVAKYLFPRRWDLAVFHYPGKPNEVFAKRLIGMPGEQVEIKDGAVWINGKRQTPPDTISGIEYLSEIPDIRTPIWGSESRPVLLGEDEYFVLGDFSARSMDSRLWNQGAPGHPPYAVPKSYMVGVVTHTIWPSHRIRVHR